LIAGHYKLLDGLTKWIMIALTTATVAAVVIAAGPPLIMTTVDVGRLPESSIVIYRRTHGLDASPVEFAVITPKGHRKVKSGITTTKRQGLPTSMSVILFLPYYCFFLALAYLSSVWLRTRD
jgi:hypothetical protein